MFCPKCRSEFEAGYTRCAACDADLIESLSVDEEECRERATIFASDSCLYHDSPVIKEYTDLVTVFQGDEGVASLVRAKLESCGIDACLQREPYLRLVVPILGQVLVQVRARDAEAACKMLEDAESLGEDAESVVGQDPEKRV